MANTFGLAELMKGVAMAGVDLAKDAATLLTQQEVNGSVGGTHPAISLEKKETVSVEVGFVEGKNQG